MQAPHVVQDHDGDLQACRQRRSRAGQGTQPQPGGLSMQGLFLD